MDQTIWSALPNDVLFENIFPFCDIDTRLALKIKPRRLSLTRFETGDFFKAMQLRYAPNPFDGIKGVNYVMIPMHTIAGWDPSNNTNCNLKLAIVNLSIWYDYRNKDSIHIRVTRIDQREYPDTHIVGDVFIRPRV